MNKTAMKTAIKATEMNEIRHQQILCTGKGKRKAKAKAVIAMLACAVAALFTCAAYGHQYNKGYISWGVDEFELFGLTKSELSQQFKKRLSFDIDYSHAYVGDICRCQQFNLIFKNKRVCAAQRQLQDGAGCNLMGTEFTSKEQALRFAIDGLSELNGIRPEEEKTLATAKKLLLEIERTKARKGRYL
jgi:hypothetical protein